MAEQRPMPATPASRSSIYDSPRRWVLVVCVLSGCLGALAGKKACGQSVWGRWWVEKACGQGVWGRWWVEKAWGHGEKRFGWLERRGGTLKMGL